MCQPCLQKGIQTGRRIEPRKKTLHFNVQTVGRRRFVVDVFMSGVVGDNLHGAILPAAPGANGDPPCQPVRDRKKSRMPAPQTFCRQRLVISLCCIEHHFHYAIHMPGGRNKTTNIKTQLSCQRRAHLGDIKAFSFYGTGSDNILRQHLESGLGTYGETKGCHPSQEQSLPVADVCQPVCQAGIVPSKIGPVRPFVDISYHPRHPPAAIAPIIHRIFCGEYTGYSPYRQGSSSWPDRADACPLPSELLSIQVHQGTSVHAGRHRLCVCVPVMTRKELHQNIVYFLWASMIGDTHGKAIHSYA